MANSPFKNPFFPNLDPEAMENLIKRKPEKEYKPLKRPDPSKKAGSKQYKVLIPTKKELKPLKPSPRNIHPIGPSAVAVAQKAVFTPTHFPKKTPMLPFFRGQDRKFNIPDVRNLLRAELERILASARPMPKMGNEEKLLVVDPLSGDFSRYYFEINDPDVLIHDFNLILESNPLIESRVIGMERELSFSPDIHLDRRNRGYIHIPKDFPDYHLPTYGAPPLWYRGFVHNSYILYQTINPSPERTIGKIRLWDSGKVVDIPIIIEADDRGGGLSAIEKIEFARRLQLLPKDHDQFLQLVEHTAYSNYLQNSLVFYDLFNHVSFYGPTDHSVRLTYVRIVYNDVVILDTREIDPEFNEKVNLINSTQGFDLTSMIIQYKYRQLGEKTSVRNNEILKICAQELGHAWSSKYGAPWGDEWCYDFSSWVMEQAGIASVPRPPIPGTHHHLGLTELRDFFIRAGRYINGDPVINNRYRKGPLSYQDLGEAIKPGFFVELDNACHGVFFIEWDGGFRNSISNDYKLINGNSDYKVKMGKSKVYSMQAQGDRCGDYVDVYKKYRHKDFYWLGNLKNNYLYCEVPNPKEPGDIMTIPYKVYDGFCDTEGPMVVRAFRKAIDKRRLSKILKATD